MKRNNNDREIVSVLPKGLNSRDETGAAEEVYCSRLHNLSLRNGVWENMAEPKRLKSITTGNGYTVAYRHPVLPDNRFIATKGSEVALTELNGGTLTRVAVICTLAPSTPAESLIFSHFGNLLFISYPNSSGRRTELRYLYHKQGYRAFNIDLIDPIANVRIDYRYKEPTIEANRPAPLVAEALLSGGSYPDHTLERYEEPYALTISRMNDDGFIYGAVCLMFAYRLYDGSVVKNGKIYMLDAEKNCLEDSWPLYFRKEGNYYRYFKQMTGFKPRITFYVDNALIDNELVKSIVIYASRDNLLYDFSDLLPVLNEKSSCMTETVGGLEYRKLPAKAIHRDENRKLANLPFYEIAEIPLDNSGGSTTDDPETGTNLPGTVTDTATGWTETIPSGTTKRWIRLDYRTHFQQIEMQPVFKPSGSLHRIDAAGKTEYNSRLHLFDLYTTLYEGASPLIGHPKEFTLNGTRYLQDSDSVYDLHTVVELQTGGEIKRVDHTDPYLPYRKVPSGGAEANEYILLPALLVYPDFRATKLTLYVKNRITSKSFLIRSFKLESAPANNMAYCQPEGKSAVLFNRLILCDFLSMQETPVPEISREFASRNKISVSEINNPYVFAPEHTYDIGPAGESVISDINIPTDQLTETRFGDYPLYVFTSTGIYALQSGTGSVLYSSVIRINNDRILPGRRSVSAADKLYYPTNEGIMALSANLSRTVSDPLKEGPEGIPCAPDGAGPSFAEYLAEADLIYREYYHELLVYNPGYGYAYTCALDEGQWSTCDFGGRMIGSRLLSCNGGVCDLSARETGKLLPALLESREICFSGRELKKIDGMRTRLSGTSDFMTVTLWGSNDAKAWQELGRCGREGFIRRTPGSRIWFRVKIEGGNFSLQRIDFEFYRRFIRHLR